MSNTSRASLWSRETRGAWMRSHQARAALTCLSRFAPIKAIYCVCMCACMCAQPLFSNDKARHVVALAALSSISDSSVSQQVDKHCASIITDRFNHRCCHYRDWCALVFCASLCMRVRVCRQQTSRNLTPEDNTSPSLKVPVSLYLPACSY